MGDRHVATIDMGRKLGGGCAFFLRGRCGAIERKVAWAETYLHTKWHLDPFSRLATIDIGQKLGAPSPFGQGELGPHLTQRRLG